MAVVGDNSSQPNESSGVRDDFTASIESHDARNRLVQRIMGYATGEPGPNPPMLGAVEQLLRSPQITPSTNDGGDSLSMEGVDISESVPDELRQELVQAIVANPDVFADWLIEIVRERYDEEGGDLIRLQSELLPRLQSTGGRPSDPNWTMFRPIPMQQDTWARLNRTADVASTDKRRVSPAQIAGYLLEKGLEKLDIGQEDPESA